MRPQHKHLPGLECVLDRVHNALGLVNYRRSLLWPAGCVNATGDGGQQDAQSEVLVLNSATSDDAKTQVE